jgi:hypothetical protein
LSIQSVGTPASCTLRLDATSSPNTTFVWLTRSPGGVDREAGGALDRVDFGARTLFFFVSRSDI